jgi:hypothetical protein
VRAWTGLSWLRIRSNGGEHCDEHLGSIKVLKITEHLTISFLRTTLYYEVIYEWVQMLHLETRQLYKHRKTMKKGRFLALESGPLTLNETGCVMYLSLRPQTNSPQLIWKYGKRELHSTTDISEKWRGITLSVATCVYS